MTLEPLSSDQDHRSGRPCLSCEASRLTFSASRLGIAVALVVRHVTRYPLRQFNGLILMLEFDLSKDQTGECALEHVHVPHHAVMLDRVACLLKPTLRWNKAEQELGC